MDDGCIDQTSFSHIHSRFAKKMTINKLINLKRNRIFWNDINISKSSLSNSKYYFFIFLLIRFILSTHYLLATQDFKGCWTHCRRTIIFAQVWVNSNQYVSASSSGIWEWQRPKGSWNNPKLYQLYNKMPYNILKVNCRRKLCFFILKNQ